MELSWVGRARAFPGRLDRSEKESDFNGAKEGK